MTLMGDNLQHLYILRVFRNNSAIMDKARQFNSYNFRRANHQASYYWQCKIPHKAQTTHIGLITKGIEQFDLIIEQEWERIFIIKHRSEITTFKVTTVTKMAIKQAGAFNEKFTKPVTRIMAASKMERKSHQECHQIREPKNTRDHGIRPMVNSYHAFK